MKIGIRSGRSGKTGLESRYWWHIDKLEPGQIVSKSFADLATEAAKNMSTRQKGPFEYTVISFHVTYHRGVDRKRDTARTHVMVMPGSETGKPTVVADIEQPYPGEI
jgi:hypothetical protein